MADRHPDLNIVTYQQSRAIADQLNVILSSTITNDTLAMFCMFCVALIFIPNPICALFITFAMVTIDIGNLDPSPNLQIKPCFRCNWIFIIMEC